MCTLTVQNVDAKTFNARWPKAELAATIGRYCIGTYVVAGRRNLVVRELFGRPEVVRHELTMVRAVHALGGDIGPPIEALAIDIDATKNTARGWVVCERLRPLERNEFSGRAILRMLQNVRRMHTAGIYHGNLHWQNVMQRASLRNPDSPLFITDPGCGAVTLYPMSSAAHQCGVSDWVHLCTDLHRVCPIPRWIVDLCLQSGVISPTDATRWATGSNPTSTEFDTNEIYMGILR